jgi:hypothetical protein
VIDVNLPDWKRRNSIFLALALVLPASIPKNDIAQAKDKGERPLH